MRNIDISLFSVLSKLKKSTSSDSQNLNLFKFRLQQVVLRNSFTRKEFGRQYGITVARSNGSLKVLQLERADQQILTVGRDEGIDSIKINIMLENTLLTRFELQKEGKETDSIKINLAGAR